jgi:Fe-S-cluster-containing hydrogenase component 2
MATIQKIKRPIIEIDRELCNGCGLCTTACAENALVLDDENKAVLVKEIYCDGLGACLDVCPTGALKVVDREVDPYDADASYKHVKNTRGTEAAKKVHGYESKESKIQFSGCPGTMAREIKASPAEKTVSGGNGSLRAASELTQWPVQLKLVSPAAPYFRECDLLIAADCTAFSLGSFHRDLLKGKKLVIACPKLDDISGYVEKLAQIIGQNTIFSVTVAIMTVPCCTGLYRIVEEAVSRSGKNIAIKKVVVDVEGGIV